jgi:hypothetical protein
MVLSTGDKTCDGDLAGVTGYLFSMDKWIRRAISLSDTTLYYARLSKQNESNRLICNPLKGGVK